MRSLPETLQSGSVDRASWHSLPGASIDAGPTTCRSNRYCRHASRAPPNAQTGSIWPNGSRASTRRRSCRCSTAATTVNSTTRRCAASRSPPTRAKTPHPGQHRRASTTADAGRLIGRRRLQLVLQPLKEPATRWVFAGRQIMQRVGIGDVGAQQLLRTPRAAQQDTVARLYQEIAPRQIELFVAARHHERQRIQRGLAVARVAQQVAQAQVTHLAAAAGQHTVKLAHRLAPQQRRAVRQLFVRPPRQVLHVDQTVAMQNEFDMATRKVYTYADTYTDNNGVLRPAAATALLTANSNLVTKSNTAITDVMLDIVGEPDKIVGTPRIETLLSWAAGFDVFDQFGVAGTSDARQVMGDPLHSEPALVQYGGSLTAPDLVAYMATNDGYLHAIDVDDGKEIFSFIPQELLPNLNTLMDNKQGDKVYGLDGNVVAWVNDINEDGIINGADHIYLYIGMRRGGRNIYSLDVTDRNKPVLRWVIKGGSDDYKELGQTWSTINVEKIKDGASEKTVLIFGGGYDTNQDNVTVRTKDSVGRAVFIADAESGNLLWSAGPGGTQAVDDMDYSIPARVKPLDMSGDGLTDRLYVADMGGQIFRFDIDNDNGSALSSSIKGGRIADLAGNAEIDARRFYYPPDVALIAKRGEAAYLAIAAASGYRAHPLNTKIQDRIYLMKDRNVYNAPTGFVYNTLTEADLYDATLNLVGGDGTVAQQAAAKTALGNTEGWFIKLDDETGTDTWVGEKGLSEPLIIEGTAIITTFIPVTTSVTASCAPQAGSGKVFYLDLLDGSPAIETNLDVRPDRHEWLVRSGIPPTPTPGIPPDGEPTLCIGTECKAAGLKLGLRKAYWYEVEK